MLRLSVKEFEQEFVPTKRVLYLIEQLREIANGIDTDAQMEKVSRAFNCGHYHGLMSAAQRLEEIL